MELKLTKQKNGTRFFSGELKRSFSIMLVALLLSFTQNVNAQAPDWEWAKGIGGTGFDGSPSVVIDDNANTYVTAMFSGTVDFEPGVGIANLTSAGSTDVCLAKYDKNGNYIWALRMGGVGEDGTDHVRGRCIAIDKSQNIIITGFFSGTADFDPGNAVYNLTSAGGLDIFVAKYDNAGNFIWAKRMGGVQPNDKGMSIALDTNGNIYSTGRFTGTADFDPGPGVFNLVQTGGTYFMYISKLDKDGIFQWAKAKGNSGLNNSLSIASDMGGNIYVGGQYSGSGFILKYDGSGNSIWEINNIGEITVDMAIDKNYNVYTTGAFAGTVDFNPGSGVFAMTAAGWYDAFVAKYDINGNFIWASKMGNTGEDYGCSISLDDLGNYFASGYFQGTIDADPGIGVVNLTVPSGHGTYVTKSDGSNNLQWAKSVINGTCCIYGCSIISDKLGNAYVATPFISATTTFDAITISNKGNMDFAIAKIPVDSAPDPCANITCNISPYAYYTNVTSSTCNNGTIKAILKGGYKFYPHLELYDGNNNLVDSISLPKGTKTYTFTGLSTGKYTIKIFDKTCCETSDVKYIKCAPPSSGYTTTNITASSATLNWDTASCSVGYRVQYRQTGTTLWTTQKLSSNTGFADIAGLQPSTTYEWHVSTFCAGTQKFKYLGASPIQNFTTNALRMGEVITQSNDAAETFEINLFPNPATYTLTVNFEGESEMANLKVINMLGEVVLQKQVFSADGYFETQMNIADLKSGMYMLKVETENGESRKVFVKE